MSSSYIHSGKNDTESPQPPPLVAPGARSAQVEALKQECLVEIEFDPAETRIVEGLKQECLVEIEFDPVSTSGGGHFDLFNNPVHTQPGHKRYF